MKPKQLIYTAFILLVSFIIYATAIAQKSSPGTSLILQSIVDNYWKDFTRLNPLFATQNGINDYNDQLEIPINKSYINQSISFNKRYLRLIKTVNKKNLNDKDLLVAELFKYVVERDLERLALGLYYSSHVDRPVDQFVFSFPTRFATMASGAGLIPFHTVRDYENFINRMQLFPKWIDAAIENMNRGISNGNLSPKAAMLKVPAQLKPLFEGSAESSIFYKPVTTMPDSFTASDKQILQIKYVNAINDFIKPAYKKLHDYFVNTYIPQSRTTTGLQNNKTGKNEYKSWIKFWTTTETPPNKIFELGITEVARIRKEMDSIKTVTGFSGDLKAFFNYVRTDKKFFPFSSEEEVLERFRGFESRMKPAINSLFNLVPKAGFEVRATEKFRQAGANAQYMQPSRDGTIPGIFYEVIPDATKYNYHDMETLFIHEAIPGHHFQVALQQEMDVPEFMKATFFGAYAEGWALYAETLGRDLGMFDDPYQYLGRLNADMERSVRLVVDVGMHHKGWTREQAIQYVLENQPVSSAIAEQRIERYMVTPGQALSYKIGEQKIISLRKYAQSKLGAAFNIREFHDEILKDGGLPLSILQDKIERWVAVKLRTTI
jgi:uncharacterized protein (DUF885 family)